MSRLSSRAGIAASLLATALSMAWAGTSVLARLTDSPSVGANTFSTGNWGSCATPGVQPTLTADLTAYVRQDAPSLNYGGAPSMAVKSGSGTAQRAFVQFTLPALGAGCTVTAATLRLSQSQTTEVRVIGVYQAAAAWGESTVTWANQPAQTGTAATSNSKIGWQEWAVAAHVQAHYSGTNNGFVVKDESESLGSVQQLYKAGGSSPPELVVTWG